MKKKSYELGGLTCGGCVNSVKKALLEISDITEAVVHLNPPTAKLTMNKPVTLEVLQAQLKKAGQYTISELVTQ
jgi:copper chaperone CopZ